MNDPYRVGMDCALQTQAFGLGWKNGPFRAERPSHYNLQPNPYNLSCRPYSPALAWRTPCSSVWASHSGSSAGRS